jgi:hypothetical protein
VEASYNLIAIELLLYLLLPICNQPFDCSFWAIIPLAMIGILVVFIYHRRHREAEHRMRVTKAASEGHVEETGLFQEKLEEEIRTVKKRELKFTKNFHELFSRKKKKPKAVGQVEKKLVKEEVKEEPKKVEKKKAEDKKIEGIIDKVLGIGKKKKKKVKKPKKKAKKKTKKKKKAK